MKDQGLQIDAPTDAHLFLGCIHERKDTDINGRSITSMTYNVEDFFTSCVARYVALVTKASGRQPVLKHAGKPFVEEDHKRFSSWTVGVGITQLFRMSVAQTQHPGKPSKETYTEHS